MKPALLSLLAMSAGSALAAVGGRCQGFSTGCICLDYRECQRYGGMPDPGIPGHWACPWDPDNVQGCWIGFCKGERTSCQWREGCQPPDKILSGEVALDTYH